jgi:hypothetical protein
MFSTNRTPTSEMQTYKRKRAKTPSKEADSSRANLEFNTPTSSVPNDVKEQIQRRTQNLFKPLAIPVSSHVSQTRQRKHQHL